jgi:hypothetical protein
MLLVFFLVLLLSLFITPINLFGWEDDRAPQGVAEGQANFSLTIQENLISLDAEEGSLKEIIEEIGRRMNIEVIAHVSDEERAAIAFDRLSIEEVVRKLREYVKIIYVIKDSEKKQGEITKIVVFPKTQATALSRPMTTPEIRQRESLVKPERSDGEETAKETPRPAPFKFEFDPSKFGKDR